MRLKIYSKIRLVNKQITSQTYWKICSTFDIMMIIILLLFLFGLSFESAAQSTTEAVLKNGRSVVYYYTNGVYRRELEPEENEYQQYAMAKVLNVFNKVNVEGYTRIERWSTDIEDVGRTREDDKGYLPVPFKGLVAFQPASGHPNYEAWMTGKSAGNIPDDLEVMISVEVNVRKYSMNIKKPFKKQTDSLFQSVWFSEQAEVKMPLKLYSYNGPVTVIILGNISTPVSTPTLWSFAGTYPKPGFLSVSNIVIRIAASPERASQVIATLNHEKLKEALAFRQSWP